MRFPLLLALVIAMMVPAIALGHAVPVDITPRGAELTDASPAQVQITFSEEIQLLNTRDADVLDQNGQSALSSPAFVDPNDVRVLNLPLRPDLLEGTYTVGWRVMGQDTHVVPGQSLFGVGVDELASPVAVAGGAAPSETGPWAVSARTIHLAALGGLLGLLAFRWLVWRRAWVDGPTLEAGERTTMLEWGRDQFWFAFGTLALFAMVTEAYLLVVKSAIANGLSLLANLQDPAGISEVLANTRFGDLVQLRGALLFVVFGTATWQFLSEFGSSSEPKPARPVDRAFPAVLMGSLLVAILFGVAFSGHAAVAPLPAFHTAVHAVHLAALATWITGLVATLVVLRKLPNIAPNGGRAMATRVLGAFSTVATVAIALAFATGAIRAFGHLTGPEQLINTTYGNLILLKLALLLPIAVLALRSRRVLNALRRISRPSEAALLMVRRSVAIEIAVTVLIIVTAGVLAASEPGRL
jgi:copper transport protein